MLPMMAGQQGQGSCRGFFVGVSLSLTDSTLAASHRPPPPSPLPSSSSHPFLQPSVSPLPSQPYLHSHTSSFTFAPHDQPYTSSLISLPPLSRLHTSSFILQRLHMPNTPYLPSFPSVPLSLPHYIPSPHPLLHSCSLSEQFMVTYLTH